MTVLVSQSEAKLQIMFSDCLYYEHTYPQNNWSFDHLRLTCFITVDEVKKTCKIVLMSDLILRGFYFR